MYQHKFSRLWITTETQHVSQAHCVLPRFNRSVCLSRQLLQILTKCVSIGYIGGSVFELLLQDSRFDITALVRDPAKAAVLTEKFGVRTVIGAMENEKLLEEEAAKADVVINVVRHAPDRTTYSLFTRYQAALWIIPGIKALLDGSKARFERTGKKPIFINTVSRSNL